MMVVADIVNGNSGAITALVKSWTTPAGSTPRRKGLDQATFLILFRSSMTAVATCTSNSIR
jgi:hypothetical protein